MAADNKIVSDSESYTREVVEALREAEQAEDWWEAQWLKFPTVTRDAEGAWHYWTVPDDSGVYEDDWPLGGRLARETVAHMRSFPEGSTVLRRILREMDPESTVGQGFLTALEEILCTSQPPLQAV